MKTFKQLLKEEELRTAMVPELETHLKTEAKKNVTKMKLPNWDDEAHNHQRVNAHVSSYKVGAGFDVNEALRKNKVKHTEIKHYITDDDEESHEGSLAHNVAKDMVKHDKAMKEITTHPTEHSFHVYRGFAEKNLSKSIKEMPVGGTFHDHGYASTSLNHNVALKFSNKHQWDGGKTLPEDHEHVVAKIHIQPGNRGHYLENHPTGMYEHEKEFVLHKGTTFKVTGHSKGEGVPSGHPEKGLHKSKIHFVHLEIHHQDD